MLVSARGPASPDEVWRRFTQPGEWASWAPQIRSVTPSAGSAAAAISTGDTGRVHGPGPIAVRYEITDVDADLRTWTWRVGVGPLRVRMHHYVIPTADGGSRALLEVPGPLAVPGQAYRPIAGWALRGLVSPKTSEPSAETPREVVLEFAARPFGVSTEAVAVEVGPRWLYARYGPWTLLTPRANVVSAETVGDRVVRVEFAEPVAMLEPTGVLRRRRVVLGVADPEGLVAAVSSPVR